MLSGQSETNRVQTAQPIVEKSKVDTEIENMQLALLEKISEIIAKDNTNKYWSKTIWNLSEAVHSLKLSKDRSW